MRMLIAFAAVAACLLRFTAAQTVCNAGLLVQCEAGFTDFLGLPVDANWHDPELMRTNIERLFYTPGVSGISRICRAFNTFKQCMGAANYAACISVPGLVVNSIKPKPAYEYVKIFTQFHFVCGAGYNTFINNDCMAATWQTRQQQLTNCRHQFDSDADRDPNNVCLYSRDALTCYESQFGTGCPGTPDPTWWGCEYERIGTAVNYPQCLHRCSLPSAGGIGK